MGVKWVTNKFYLVRKWKLAAIAIVAVGAVVGTVLMIVAYFEGNVVFAALWLSVTYLLVLLSLIAWTVTQLHRHSLLFSPTVRQRGG